MKKEFPNIQQAFSYLQKLRISVTRRSMFLMRSFSAAYCVCRLSICVIINSIFALTLPSAAKLNPVSGFGSGFDGGNGGSGSFFFLLNLSKIPIIHNLFSRLLLIILVFGRIKYYQNTISVYMRIKNESRAQKTYLNFLAGYEKRLEKKIKKKGLTITVSGATGSGKTTIAKAIAHALGLKFVSAGDIFRSVARKRRVPIEKFSHIREKRVDYDMDRQTLKRAMQGGYLIVGRISGWVAGDWADVKIYVSCNQKVRASRVAGREKVSKIEGMKRMKQRDRGDTRKYKKLYGIDQYDRSIYDIIINNSHLTYGQAKSIPVRLVKKFLKKRKKK